MRLSFVVIIFLLIFLGLFFAVKGYVDRRVEVKHVAIDAKYWFVLHRKLNVEYLYFGTPGIEEESELVKSFKVKTGIPGERPTPLPRILGREYWVIVGREEQQDNPETAPYFLTLNIPAPEEEPFGPVRYLECKAGKQCNWGRVGAFGLHGGKGDESRLSSEDPGSSGCVRHRDEDITYLYNLLEPEKGEVRYYVEDI